MTTGASTKRRRSSRARTAETHASSSSCKNSRATSARASSRKARLVHIARRTLFALDRIHSIHPDFEFEHGRGHTRPRRAMGVLQLITIKRKEEGRLNVVDCMRGEAIRRDSRASCVCVWLRCVFALPLSSGSVSSVVSTRVHAPPYLSAVVGDVLRDVDLGGGREKVGARDGDMWHGCIRIEVRGRL